MPTFLLHPEWLDLTGPDGAICHGADQDWFPDPWQRRAGCGQAVGVPLTPTLFSFPTPRTKRPGWEQLRAFVAASLACDCPVAFLNLDNGKIRQLDRWHWVTLIGLEGDTASIVDNGNAFTMDLNLWYATTKTRGGFVCALGAGEEFASSC